MAELEIDNYVTTGGLEQYTDDINKRLDNMDKRLNKVDDTLFDVIFKDMGKINVEIFSLKKLVRVFIVLLVMFTSFILFSLLFVIKTYGYEYTAEDVVLIGKVVNHEAKNESELGKRLVIDTILNRVDSDKFPSTVKEVLNQQGQYCNPKDYAEKDIYRLIAEEIYNRTNNQVLWYRTKKYHSYGNPIIVEGNHYFSGF